MRCARLGEGFRGLLLSVWVHETRTHDLRQILLDLNNWNGRPVMSSCRAGVVLARVLSVSPDAGSRTAAV